MLAQIMNAAINGILLGGVLALLAFGLNLIFGVVKIIHLAYGQFVMLGLYLIYVLTMQLHLPLVLSALIAVFAMAILGLLTQLLVIGPLLEAPRLNQLLALAGLIIVFENLAMVIWGADYRGIPLYLPILKIADFYIRGSCLFAFLGALITLGLLYLFLNKTYIGLAIRATAQDTEIVKLMGVNSRLIYFITLAAGGALTGIVAAFFTPIYTIHPHFGSSFTIMAFIIVVLGGMGNLLGGFFAAFIIGVVTSVSAVLTTTEVADIIALLIFILVMLIRPQGLLGTRGTM